MSFTLFLHASLSSYFINSVVAYAEAGNKALVIYHPAQEEAPFDSQILPIGLRECFIEKPSTNKLVPLIRGVIAKDSPNVITISGWFDPEYISLVRILKKSFKFVSILEIDNVFTGTLRQRLGIIYFRLRLRNLFDRIWIPGSAQIRFAQLLGFKQDFIYKGLYVQPYGPIDVYGPIKKAYPPRLLYVGRLIDFKKIDALTSAFASIQNKRGWQLHVIGTGPLENHLVQCESIIYRGFLQPRHLPEEYLSASAYCLPSQGEHWGVAVQEACHFKLPLLLSTGIGSRYDLAEEGVNCWIFDPNNIEDLKIALNSLFDSNFDYLRGMGVRSAQLSARITNDHWQSVLNA